MSIIGKCEVCGCEASKYDCPACLQSRVLQLEHAIRSVVTQRADDVCWMDVYVTLGKLVGIEVTPESLALLPTPKFLGNCERLIDSLKGGCPYDKDYATERIKELEDELATLRGFTARPFYGARSSKWPRVRAEHLAEFPTCAACGTSKHLEVHHVEPVHLHPERELDPKNLLTLCDGPMISCHFLIGHLLRWASHNCDAVQDAAIWLAKIKGRPTYDL